MFRLNLLISVGLSVEGRVCLSNGEGERSERDNGLFRWLPEAGFPPLAFRPGVGSEPYRPPTWRGRLCSGDWDSAGGTRTA